MTGPSYEEKRQIFERHFLLGKLSGDEIDTLLHYARVERYPSGREIFSKGSPGQCMMAVLRGTVKMSSVSPEGKEIVFNIMNPGECFGEIALLDGEERSADAVAMTDCELLVLNRRDFMPILEKRADHLHDPAQDSLPAAAADERAGRGRAVSASRSRGSRKRCCTSPRAPACTGFPVRRSNFTSHSENSAISWAAAGKASTNICRAGTRQA